MQNDYGNSTRLQLLLVLNASIYSQENSEACRFRGCKKRPIFQASKTSETGRLAIVVCKGSSQRLVNAFVKQNAHSKTSQQEFFCLLEGGDRRFASDGGETFKEFFEGVACLEIIEEGPKGNPCAAKDGCSAHDFWIFDDDVHLPDCSTRLLHEYVIRFGDSGFGPAEFGEGLGDAGEGEADDVEVVALDARDVAASAALDGIGAGFVVGFSGGEVA
jgi:hypothetical protein